METKNKLNGVETSITNEMFRVNQDSDKNIKQHNIQKLPLPYIKNLRKWINNDKKAS